MGDLVLLRPGLLALVLLVPLLLWMRARRGRQTILLAPASLLPAGRPLPVSWRVRLLPLVGTLEAAGLLLLVLAAARPVERTLLPLRTEGAEVLLCLDVSSSMSEKDLERGRTRLEVAKDAAARFVAGRPQDRIGLLCFARYPDLRCPPTLDHGALAEILRGVAPVAADGPEDATGIGNAAARAAQVLKTGASKSRVVILLTDGEETVTIPGGPGGIPPLHGAQLCAELGVRVHAVRALPAGGSRAPPDPRPLRDLADRTGGSFHEATDAASLAAVYAQIDALERAPFERQRFAVVERFQAFVAFALALLVLARLLRAAVFAGIP